MSNLSIIAPEIIPLGSPVLLSDPVELYKKFQVLEDICIRERGVGLSAVQIGWPENLFVAKINNRFQYFINCEYIPIGVDKVESIEGCLSLREIDGRLRMFSLDRYKSILVNGSLLKFKDSLFVENFESSYSGYDAIVIQHEIDHQKGILISNIGKEIMVY